ncbi:MAG: cellulase family glycosylhydrolase [Muribaculaceae bacterium]|nr:cellulase family glycosylhydrolase [Muribaculaceae bacterium]
MRRSDTNAEVSYFGTNYTVPFAHAYRALGYLQKDRKEAISRDVRQMSRLGLNAFRLHLWEAEITDADGNLLENEHLDLLDYLIAQLEKEGIDIILTAQTNFGNGYPERNIDTGSFTYDFDKCHIHENPTAQQAQQNYLEQLTSHINPYTGHSYASDNAIIAIEINNEPCHSGTPTEVTNYINRMASAIRSKGFDKPILYNVSHNRNITPAYYDADINGTTYQWYPTGLVAGYERKGNFLPYIAEYNIPWKDSIPAYNRMVRAIYECDPGDVLYSYMYPAMVRTLRKEGFQWITQFAYDPTELAGYNTEYQTHYLNLAYTPSKALSMMIAAEAARNTERGKNYGSFPNDTIFAGVRVSYRQDLSELNTPERFYYTNTTNTQPSIPDSLQHIAGHGSSPIISYEGTGAYFLDRTTQPGVWRLEVWPDVVLTADPFAKPSLKRRIGEIIYASHPITISLPELQKGFSYIRINDDSKELGTSVIDEKGVSMQVRPGVYLLSKEPSNIEAFSKIENNDRLRRFDAPEATLTSGYVLSHTPVPYTAKGKDLEIEVKVYGATQPDSVVLFPSTVSFWRSDNPTVKMQRKGDNTYTAVLPATQTHTPTVSYAISIYGADEIVTWPAKAEGDPLAWDYTAEEWYTIPTLEPNTPIVLLNDHSKPEASLLPTGYNLWLRQERHSPTGAPLWVFTTTPDKDGVAVIRQYAGNLPGATPYLKDKKQIVVKAPHLPIGSKIGLTDKNGSSYSTSLTTKNSDGTFTVNIADMIPESTLLIPAAYPDFLKREVKHTEYGHADITDIDFIDLIIPTVAGQQTDAVLEGIWLQ